MSTEKQTTANRLNALKSTGPKTEAGKAAVRMNPLKHGLLATDVIIPGESAEDLSELREQLWACFHPVGRLEEDLTERLAIQTWRQYRCVRVEEGIFASQIQGRLLHLDGEVQPAQAFINRSDIFLKLARYENHCERSYFQTLHELQRLQAARAGQPVPLPAAVDVNMQITTIPDEHSRPAESDPASADEFLPKKAA
jgi:hypothetical protein